MSEAKTSDVPLLRYYSSARFWRILSWRGAELAVRKKTEPCNQYNKPRTDKVGAISKAQKCKRGNPSGFVKLQLVTKCFKKMRGSPLGTWKNFTKKFLVTVPKNFKGGTLWGFLTSIALQNVEKNERGLFGAIQKVSKTSYSAEKKVGLWGDP